MSTQTTVIAWINDEINNADKQMSDRDSDSNGWLVFHSRKAVLEQVADVIKNNLVAPIRDERESAFTTMTKANRAGDQAITDIAAMRAETFKTALKIMGYPVEDLC